MLDYYLAADKSFYEPLDRRPVASADFVDFVASLIDGGWALSRKGVWVNCHARANALPLQGWKIHLSSTPAHARRLLEAVAPFLVARGVSFKFIADLDTLRMTGAKTWSRGASGKFVTIYPIDEAQFRRLLDELDELTRGFDGPYILSDRRYGKGKVLFYRYGGIRPNPRLQADGQDLPVLVAPDGREIPDERGPEFRLPDWVADPFPGNAPGAGTGPVGRGEYSVEKALHFSNTGGVYVARDSSTGRRVVLKEARAHIHSHSDSHDAAALLRNEYEILSLLADDEIAPRPFALFQEWEHLFLAEEYLEGYIPIRNYSAKDCLFLETRPRARAVAAYAKRELELALKVARAVEKMHARGVIWGDISFNNILVHPDTMDVKIIDLEGAHRSGSSGPHRMFTSGFADMRRLSNAPATVADDYYGVGAVILFLFTHSNLLMPLDPEAPRRVLEEMRADFGLPESITRLVDELMSAEPDARPGPVGAISRVLDGLGGFGRIRFARPASDGEIGRERLLEDAVCHIRANADPAREDRLFPADPLVHQTNGVSLAHGAAGVLHALAKIGAVDSAHADWLAKATLSGRRLPPGLYTGLAGAAWALLELGRGDQALEALARSRDLPQLRACADLYSGLAGWGMAQLKFWRATGNREHLLRAEESGMRLLDSATQRDEGLCWPDSAGKVRYGLFHGSSGIGLFLLYLDLALGGGRYARAARAALDFDLAQGVETPGGGASWPRGEDEAGIVSPYLRNGTAGVGVACLRFWKAGGEAALARVIERMRADCDRKYTVFPGRNDGLCGIGEFLLDAHDFTGDPAWLVSAERLAAGLRLFAIRRQDGVGFPGNGLARLSCDLATGSAGIVVFLDRMRRGGSASFLLDDLILGAGS